MHDERRQRQIQRRESSPTSSRSANFASQSPRTIQSNRSKKPSSFRPDATCTARSSSTSDVRGHPAWAQRVVLRFNLALARSRHVPSRARCTRRRQQRPRRPHRRHHCVGAYDLGRPARTGPNPNDCSMRATDAKSRAFRHLVSDRRVDGRSPRRRQRPVAATRRVRRRDAHRARR